MRYDANQVMQGVTKTLDAVEKLSSATWLD
jgi:hypothetical protein